MYAQATTRGGYHAVTRRRRPLYVCAGDDAWGLSWVRAGGYKRATGRVGVRKPELECFRGQKKSHVLVVVVCAARHRREVVVGGRAQGRCEMCDRTVSRIKNAIAERNAGLCRPRNDRTPARTFLTRFVTLFRYGEEGSLRVTAVRRGEPRHRPSEHRARAGRLASADHISYNA
jgi:hypothetical protein